MGDDKQQTDGVAMPNKQTLIRDVAVLQVKLVVDGLRDFLLVPISLIAGLVSLFKPADDAGNEFYDLLRLGRKSERWINLFGAADRVPATDEAEESFPDEDIDSLVSRVESFVVDEYKNGGVTKQAKDRLDRLLVGLHKRRGQRRADR